MNHRELKFSNWTFLILLHSRYLDLDLSSNILNLINCKFSFNPFLHLRSKVSKIYSS